MISSTGELVRELKKTDDAFVAIFAGDKEYVIETIIRRPNFGESASSYVQLVCRDGGDGYIRR